MQQRSGYALAVAAVLLAGACGAGGGSGGSPSNALHEPTGDPSQQPPATASPSPLSPRPGTRTIRLYFDDGDCEGGASTERTVADTPAIATAALHELFAGPTAQERQRGLGFPAVGKDLLRSIRVDAGTAYVDLNDAFAEVNNVSTSCGSLSFTNAVRSTLIQFTTIQDVRYAIAGSPSQFYTFMQLECPQPCDPMSFAGRP